MIVAFLRKNVGCLILKHISASASGVSRSPFSSSTSTVSDILIHKHDLPPELASRVGFELKHPQKLENADSVLSFLKESGFSNAQLVKIVKSRPRILAANLENSIKPKIKRFQEEGFSSDDIRMIISTCPPILCLSVDKKIIPSLSVLIGLIGSKDALATVLKNSQRLLHSNFDNTVIPNVEFLKSCGIPMARIRIIFKAFPNSFALKPEVVRKSAEKAVELGLNATSKMFIYAIPVIASLSNGAWELKLQGFQGFRNLGFSDNDILTMFRKAPEVFSGSMEKIKKIKELLLATGKFDVSSIVNCPASLQFSIEKRYEPRLRILRVLESRRLIKSWPTLRTIIILSDDMFFKKFSIPAEVSQVHVRKNRGKKNMKPSV